MPGEMRGSQFLERQEQQFRAGVRLLASACLLVMSSYVAVFAAFGVGMRGLGAALSGRPIDRVIFPATSALAWLLVVCAVVLAIAFIRQHRWLWPALGAWLTALALTAAAVWVYSFPENAGFAALLSAVATALGTALYWAVRRFGSPAA